MPANWRPGCLRAPTAGVLFCMATTDDEQLEGRDATAEALHEWNVVHGYEEVSPPGQLPPREVPIFLHADGIEIRMNSGLRRSYASRIREIAAAGWWPPPQPPPPA